MFLKILKKDLKRKKSMNIVLFILIVLASTLVASSTNLMYSTTTAINSFISKSKVAGYLRFSYFLGDSRISTLVIMDVILLLALSAILAILLYVKIQIITPFHVIEEMPFELSKGHLKQGLKENKSRFFGKFIWGLDLLRESLESQKLTNLHLEKDRQTLVASISHELKTPVAAIKLYSTALYDNLYESEAKRQAYRAKSRSD